MVIVVALSHAVYAEYCVGKSCGAGEPGFHRHGCYDLGKNTDGSENFTALGCMGKVYECWDHTDGTCNILAEWGAQVGNEKCVDAVPKTSLCVDYMEKSLGDEKYRRMRKGQWKAVEDSFQSSSGQAPSVTSSTSTGMTTAPARTPDPPPVKHDWTPVHVSGPPLSGGAQQVTYENKDPCATCVSFGAPPTVDAKDPVTRDARDTRVHYEEQHRLDQVAGQRIPPPPWEEPQGPPPTNLTAPPVTFTKEQLAAAQKRWESIDTSSPPPPEDERHEKTPMPSYELVTLHVEYNAQGDWLWREEQRVPTTGAEHWLYKLAPETYVKVMETLGPLRGFAW